MKAISTLLHFLSQHPAWSFLIIVVLFFGIALLTKRLYWLIPGFILALANIFTAPFLNAWFLQAWGTPGTAVIIQATQTNSTFNDQYIFDYTVIAKGANGKDVKTGFSSMSAAIWPIRNEVLLPPAGQTFVTRYIPGNEENIVIMAEESLYGKMQEIASNRTVVDVARNQLAASPGNEAFREEYRQALKVFLSTPSNQLDSVSIRQFRDALSQLESAQPVP
ncbi:hypothetical protein [Chitinophaga deserti]|uniref:hypothetical protein n=1 Tax=Chitinophaga deserti TaxID=2164099 RepID=UPI000D6B7B2F|nr:hypothetical protein [Chitinophaga deserti]